jgi:tetratricopeptide (TPR) repeat protein
VKNFISNNKWPLAIFAAAFLIRLVYLLESRANPTFYFPMVDELWNLNWAKEIISGKFWGDDVYFRGPLYPYLLAFWLKVSGGSLFFARFCQIIIAALSAVLVYLIGNRLLGKKVGIISGLVYGFYGTLLFYENMLLIPVVFQFLNLLGVYLLILFKGIYDPKKWLLAGVIFGLAAITRPNILLPVPLFMLWIYMGLKASVELKKRFYCISIFLLGVFIPILPVTVRNYVVSGEPILISSQGGVNLYIGNNPDSEGLTMLMPEVRLDESLPWTEFAEATRKAAEEEVGHSLLPGEESSFWTKKALRFMVDRPVDFISLTLRKVVYFFVGFENSDQTDIYAARRYSALYSLLLWKNLVYFPFGLLFPLAAVGVLAMWKRRSELSLVYIFILGYLPTVVLFLVTARHRLPVIPFLIILAVCGLLYVIDIIRQKKWIQFYKPASLFLILLILSNQTYFDIGFENKFQTHFNLALTYNRQGELAKAEKEYQAALDIYPNSATTWNSLGYLQYQLGKPDKAMRSFTRAIELDSNFAEAYNNTGLVFEQKNEPEQALLYYRRAVSIDPDMYQAYINIGDIFLTKGDYSRSEQVYSIAADKAPDMASPLYKLGALYARQRRFAEAENMFKKGEKLGHPSAIDNLNWGNIYFSTNKPSQAIERYQSALVTDSTFFQAYINLSLTFRNYNYPADSARKYLNRLLQLDPNNAAARRFLQELN